MIKKVLLTLAGVLLLIGLPAGVKVWQFRVMASMPVVEPPETVTAAPARRETWPRTLRAIGTLTAVQGVTLGTELDGKVVEIAFQSGDRVAAGDLLVQLDTSAEDAQLRAAEAAMELARINLERIRDLLARRSASQSDFDSANAQFKQASAQADSVRAVIAKKTLRAPFSGHLGVRLINLGQILRAGEPIATLQTLDPIYVDFSLPQQRLSLLAPGVEVRVTTDAAPGQTFQGRINAVNPEVDTRTRTVRAQATLSNDGETLRPGMFADVQVLLPEPQEVIAIPATAVLYAPYGDTVFVIEEQTDADTGEHRQVLRQQVVRLGDTRGDFVAVVSGLAPGETVVTSGVFKLRPGIAVVVDNTLAPPAEIAPQPDNR